MQAMKVYRLADGPLAARLYLDGRQVDIDIWNAAHYGRDTDTYVTRLHKRKGGNVVVREYHSIRGY
mgnify:CR=1 FL=1